MKQKAERLLSIDIFRGLTVALMILVNSLDDNHGVSWLAHSEWNGCSLADLVFPFFIFIVGVSVTLSFSKLRSRGMDTGQLLHKAIKRTAFLFVVGLLLNAYPKHFDFYSLRIMGVLQRIAICYFFSALFYLTTRIRTQAIMIAVILTAYWFIMKLTPVPGYGAGDLGMQGNAATYFDGLLLSANHLFRGGMDPEGILSSFPAIATALSGNLLGAWLLSNRDKKTNLFAMSCAGLIITVAGWLFGLVFPINKSLWTSSYVLWTSGLALIVFSILYWLVDVRGWKTWLKPFEIFGRNAMAAFILHVLFLKTQVFLFVRTSSGDLINLRQFLTEQLFGWTSMQHASLYYGLFSILFWLLIVSFFSFDIKKQISLMSINKKSN